LTSRFSQSFVLSLVTVPCFLSLLVFVLIFALSLSSLLCFCAFLSTAFQIVRRCTCTFIRIFMGHNRFLKW
jgi:hypothetical protein